MVKECRLVEEALREAFMEVFREKLVSPVLYGSYARREARCDSDIDVMVVVDDGMDRFEVHRLLNRVDEILGKRLQPLKAKGANPFFHPTSCQKVLQPV